MGTSKTTRKRVRQTEARTLRNKAVRSAMKTAVRRVREALDSGNRTAAQEALTAAVPVIAGTASKGLIHKNNASRKISRLTRRVNAL